MGQRTRLKLMLRQLVLLSAWLIAQVACGQQPDPKRPSGDAVIRGKVGDSEIVIKTTDRLAGAIHSLTWRGMEFIDSQDHGRQLQSACSFGGDGPFYAEAFNPTEAGSRHDGAGAASSSRLFLLRARGNCLETTTQMAFWLRPGEKSNEHPAKNKTVLSNYFLRKRVTIGSVSMPNVVEYIASFTVPEGETHTYAQFEAVTGYMPKKFSRFETYRFQTDQLKPLSVEPGEQPLPIVFSTPDGRLAMGIFSPDQPSKRYEAAGYGRFAFWKQDVVKWNCVFRVRDPRGIKAGDYTYRNYVAVGTRDDVKVALKRLHETK
ncbi:MAG: hypothetical protein VB835_10330 [Pirellulales bacterium]